MERTKRVLSVIMTFAVCLLTGCEGGEQQRQQLVELERQNLSGESLQNDTLAEELVDYFDRHGTSNERMRARYILGRTYFCLGELPRALETYNEAVACADTTAQDCDYAKLSRVHAQNAQVFRRQVQPRTQLSELKLAERYAMKAKDTLMAIECMEQRAIAYKFLNDLDSALFVSEEAAQHFLQINREDRYAQTLSSTITPLIAKGKLDKAKRNIDIYDSLSGFFDYEGNICKGREIYYYIKGNYYLAVGKIDSAEYLFRKEMRDGKDLNNQIAGSKGLMEVYEQYGISDSISKYAKLAYELNDSAYKLSEMQNIQKFQASYNYEHNRLLAEQKAHEAEKTQNLLTNIIALFIIVVLLASYLLVRNQKKKQRQLFEYRQTLEKLREAQKELTELRMLAELQSVEQLEEKNKRIKKLEGDILIYQNQIKKYQQTKSDKDAAKLEDRLVEAEIVLHLKDLVEKNPPEKAFREDFKQLRFLINEEIPVFYSTLNTPHYTLTTSEYEICLLIRCHFLPSAISKLTGISDDNIAKIRRRLLLKIYEEKGSPKDFDSRVLAIK